METKTMDARLNQIPVNIPNHSTPYGSAPANCAGRTILAVDDNENDIWLLARALSPVMGASRFIAASDGAEAQVLVQRMSEAGASALPAVILTDIKMPILDGFEFLEWIKGRPACAQIPVVLLSSFDDPSHLTRARSLGAYACLTKPPEPTVIQSLVAKFIHAPDAHAPRSEARQSNETPGLAADKERHTAAQPSKRILLADDDASVREMLGRVLESEHYKVILAKDGNEAAAKSVSGEPDLVLLDLNMPDRDGWSAFRFMNAAHPLRPVIVITARPNQYPQADQLGVDALMEKPLNLALLLRTIQSLLSEPESQRARRVTDRGFKTAFLGSRFQHQRAAIRL
jgi:CheY-like chemotaxis protein